MAYTQAQLTTFFTNAGTGVAPTAAPSLTLQALASQNATGQLTDAAALQGATNLAANGSTDVLVGTYQFFLGFSPSVAGLTALNPVFSATGAQGNLNGENRFIAQSIALATQNATAKTAFTTSYGALTVAQTAAAAYNIIIGQPAATAAGINIDAAVAYLSSAASVAYFTGFVRANTTLTATADIDLAVKAAIVGEIMFIATSFNFGAGLGAYSTATNNLVADLSDDGNLTANNAAGINLLTAYGSGGSTGVPTPGSTLALTAGIDTLNGTANDDTINSFIVTGNATTAVATTFQGADTVTGGTGTDTLNITVLDNTAVAVATGAQTIPAASVTGVENINIRNLSIVAADVTTVAAGNFAGATQFISDRSSGSLTVTGLAAGQAVGFNGVSPTASGTPGVTALIASYTSATAAAINLSNGVVDAAGTTPSTIVINAGSAPITAATISSTGAANTVGAVTVGAAAGTVSALNINAVTGLTTGAFTGFGSATASSTGTIAVTGAGAVTIGGLVAGANANFTTLNITTGSGTLTTGTIGAVFSGTTAAINISGASATTTANAASVNVGVIAAAVGTLNASGLTAGGVAATLGANAATNFTGGTGTDIITIGAGQGAAISGTLNAGTGTDIIAFTTGADLAANLTSRVSGFETLRVSNGGAVGTTQTYDPTLINGIASYQVAASSGAVQLNNLLANANVTVVGSVAGTAGLALNLNNAGGAADVVNLTIGNTATTGANVSGLTTTAVTLGGSATAGQVETLNIISTGRNTGTGTYNNVTLGASGAGPNFTDANTVKITGTVGLTLTTGIAQHSITIDGSAAGPLNITNTAAVTGTATLIGGASNDTISSANTATIYGAGGGDALTGGAGAQTFVYKAAAESTLDITTAVAGSSGTGGTVNVGKMDVITAFTAGTDKIDVSNIGGFNAAAQGGVVNKGTVADLNALVTILNTAGLYTDGVSVRGFAQVTVGANTYVAVDVNHDGAFSATTDLLIQLAGNVTLTSTDFIS